MNPTEVGVLRECAAQGACNRCSDACSAADKQEGNRCSGLDDSERRYRCYREAGRSLETCQRRCLPFCPGPVPDELPIVSQAPPLPVPSSPRKQEPKKPETQAGPQAAHPVAKADAPKPAPPQPPQPNPPAPQPPDEVTIGGDASDWPPPGPDEQLIQQDGRAGGSPAVVACAQARLSAYVALGNVCFSGHLALNRYLVFSPACHCTRDYESHYSCTVHAEATCHKQPSPQSMFGKSRSLTDEAAAREEAINDVKSQDCHGVRQNEQVLGCNTDPTTHEVTCFASAACYPR